MSIKFHHHLLPLFIWLGIIIIILAFFWNNLSFGAQSSDSPAYIFLASRISRHLPLNYHDQIIDELNNLQENNIVNLSLPKQYSYSAENNLLVHKYPIGLSLILSLGYWLCGNQAIGWYLSYILCILGALPLLYYIILALFHEQKNVKILGIIGCILLFTQTIFFSYFIAPPSRDIIILTISLAIILLLLKNSRNKTFLIIAAFLFILGYFTRETIILLMPLILYLIFSNKKNKWKKIAIFVIAATVFFILFLGLHYYFDREFVSWAHLIMPQADHLKSLSIDNYAHARGAIVKGQSTIFAYFKLLAVDFYALPYIIFMIICSAIYLLIKNKRWPLCAMIFLWVLPAFFFFSAWTNPYPRYLLFVFPAIIILTIVLLNYFLTLNFLSQNKYKYLAAIIFLLIIQGKQIFNIFKQPENFHKNHYEASLKYQNLLEIKQLENKLREKNNPLLIIDDYFWYELQDTWRAHANIPTINIDVAEFHKIDNLTSLLNNLNKEYSIYFLTTDQEKLFSVIDEKEKDFNNLNCLVDFSNHPLAMKCGIWIKKDGD